MIRKWSAIAFAAAVGLACGAGMASAQNAPQAASNEPTMVLTAKDSGLVIYVAPGTTVQVTLPEDMSTGYGWSVDDMRGTGQAVAYDDHHDFANMPGTDGEHVFTVKFGQTGETAMWLKKTRGNSKPIDTFFVDLRVGPVPTNMQDAAKAFVEYEMRTTCELNHITDGTVNHVFIEGNYVLGDWSCGNLSGEISFEMRGTAQVAKTLTSEGADMQPGQTALSIEWLTTELGMDQATAQKLIDQREHASH